MANDEDAGGTDGPFDFDAHEKAAVSAYLPVQPFYRAFADLVGRLIIECLKKREISVHSVQSREKEAASFGRKAATPLESDPDKPKYLDPLKEITDLAGARVITHFSGTLSEVDDLMRAEFDIIEHSDKSLELIEGDRFGYQSVHYLVRLKKSRSELAEYQRFENATAEIQVRTILQHAWAEIEHDIQYKSEQTIPTALRRRFMALAGLLELADREFQAINDAEKVIQDKAVEGIESGNLEGVEITPSSVRLLINKREGYDGRIADYSYHAMARVLRGLGFTDLRQVENAVSPYNGDNLSYIETNTRQGPVNRFELTVLAALGFEYIERHPYRSRDAWFRSHYNRTLEKFKSKGIKVGTFEGLKSSA